MCTPPEQLVGYGALLRYYDYIKQEWVIVAGTDDISIPKIMREKVETNADNGDGTKHYLVLPQSDAEDVDITADFLPAQYKKFSRMVQSNPVIYTDWQVVLNTPDQFTIEWCGALMELGGEVPKQDLVTSDIKIGYMGGQVRADVLANL